MVDYNNPTSIRPDYAYKPAGFLAGMDYAKDRQRYEDVSSLQDYMMKNDAAMSGMKMQQYQQEAPVRAAKNLADIATSNATASTIGQEKQGQVTKLNLENDLASGTLKSKISDAVSKAALSAGEAGQAELQRGMAVTSAIAQAAGSGPGAMAAVSKHLQGHPELTQFFQGAQTPGDVVKRAKLMQEAFAEADVKHKQALAVERERAQAQRDVAAIHERGQLAVVKERTKQKEKSFDQMIQTLAGKAPEARMAYLQMIMNDPDATPEQKGKATTMWNQDNLILKSRKNMQQDPGIPGLPTPQNPNLNPQGQGAQTNTGIPGVQRLP